MTPFEHSRFVRLARQAVRGIDPTIEVSLSVPPTGNWADVELSRPGNWPHPIRLYVNFDSSVHLEANGQVLLEDDLLSSTRFEEQAKELHRWVARAIELSDAGVGGSSSNSIPTSLV